MNTSQIKAYAPKARTDFIEAVTEKAARYGIHKDHIEPVTFEGDVAIIGDKAVTREEGEKQEKLARRVNHSGFEMFIRSSAYTWFNRFVAIRYMELHDFLDHGYRVLSSPDGSVSHSENSAHTDDTLHPEIIDHAADVDLPGLDKEKVIELKLAGDQDNALFRMLFIAQCNALHHAMPFLFEKVDNEEELLLPDNLLHTDSPLHNLITEVEEALWEDVEIIGWIYQFYISEKKDEVIGKQVKSQDIPAATQLFTPNWIVKYMVQNTLGRMWLATYPDSSLREKMEYYIEPARQEPDVQKELDANAPKEIDPETLTFLDPACGSGHILVEAYDILKEIYLERGYRTREIPRLILEKNLFGLDIDKRAAQLANFAVLMRARNDDRRLFSRDDLTSNILSITDTKGIDQERLNTALKNRDSGSSGDTGFWKWERVQELLELFEDAKTFGSLISIPDDIAENLPALQILLNSSPQTTDDLFLGDAEKELDHLKPILDQATLLSKRYDCVVANPPYMGSKGMNPQLKTFLKDNYPDVKSDLFSAFIVRDSELALPKGQLGFMTPFVWMFISSYEKLRDYLISQKTITTLIQLEYSGFDGATVPICTFTFENASLPEFKGGYIRLSDFKGATNQAPRTLEAIQNPGCGWFFNASAADFKKIPGIPISFWVSDLLRNIFFEEDLIGNKVIVRQGLRTGNNERFIRFLWEISLSDIGFSFESAQDGWDANKKWFPINKGGAFRRWFGNLYSVILFDKENRNILKELGNHLPSENLYFKESISWSDITSATNSFRLFPKGFLFDGNGHSIFPENDQEKIILLCYCNTKFINYIIKILSPTFHFDVGYFRKLPYPSKLFQNHIFERCQNVFDKNTEFTKYDWNSFETSSDFTYLPLFQSEQQNTDLSSTYTTLRNHWQQTTLEMQRLEEENNRIFIEAYGLEDELTAEVPLHEITLTCNPHYRYGQGKTDEAYETLLLTDTMKELISYSIGCMMGRYSLDEPGLIYAHSANEGFDPSRYISFPADDDGIIPIMDMAWFEDDAVRQFIHFMTVAWPAGSEDENEKKDTLHANLKFIADTLKPKSGESPEETIRRYLSTAFFKDHMKMYKKRPIYWLFSSGKLRAFECLVYLHRYNEATLARMRAKYVTPLQGNLVARIESLEYEKDKSPKASDQKRLQKEMDLLRKKQAELQAFDNELRHYADMKISLDLDDGVKVNYGKFGSLLAEKKAITGEK